MRTTIRIWPETPSRRQARAVLVHLAVTLPTDTLEDLDRKLPVHDALCALDETLPVGWMLAPVDPQPGDVADAYRLLAAAVHEHYADDTNTGPDDGPDAGPGKRHGERPGGKAPLGAGPGARIAVRDVIATGIAASHLRALLNPSTLARDSGPATHLSAHLATYPSAGPGPAAGPGAGEG
ncbi:MAG: hypothetical protein HY830_09600 [Actinobacteria bacterium]|nr:hypothetical protein [Actinomycetota bacterium]